tara:strand:- start:4094 stop:4261 length:168 start_codon:yes stop_codon:yes gene_type:complete
MKEKLRRAPAFILSKTNLAMLKSVTNLVSLCLASVGLLINNIAILWLGIEAKSYA